MLATHVYITEIRVGKVVPCEKLLPLIHRSDCFCRPHAVGLLYLRRAQNGGPSRRAVQIYVRIETILQRVDLRALFSPLFVYVAITDFRVDERRLADRG